MKSSICYLDKARHLLPYLITTPELYPPSSFEECLQTRLIAHVPYAALLRGYEGAENYPMIAQNFVRICAKYHCYSLISGDVFFALKYGFSGVHLKGHQFDRITGVQKLMQAHSKHLFIFYSAHHLDEMIEADQQGVDAITISPIFSTPNKGEPLGIQFLQNLRHPFSAKIFALGGVISLSQLSQLQNIKSVQGFASIRYFLKF